MRGFPSNHARARCACVISWKITLFCCRKAKSEIGEKNRSCQGKFSFLAVSNKQKAVIMFLARALAASLRPSTAAALSLSRNAAKSTRTTFAALHTSPLSRTGKWTALTGKMSPCLIWNTYSVNRLMRVRSDVSQSAMNFKLITDKVKSLVSSRAPICPSRVTFG